MPVNYVTVGQNKTLLIVGLGNLGKAYDGTRHNIGFAVADNFVNKNSDLSNWVEKKDLKCQLASGRIGECRIVVVKPITMMNLSGEAVQLTANFYKIPTPQILVIHDDLDINFGQIRTRTGGASAGHNGVKSVTQTIGENYGRMRVGIGPKEPSQIDSADFVLAKFAAKEKEQLPNLLIESNAILSEYTFGAGQLNADTRNFIV